MPLYRAPITGRHSHHKRHRHRHRSGESPRNSPSNNQGGGSNLRPDQQPTSSSSAENRGQFQPAQLGSLQQLQHQQNMYQNTAHLRDLQNNAGGIPQGNSPGQASSGGNSLPGYSQSAHIASLQQQSEQQRLSWAASHHQQQQQHMTPNAGNPMTGNPLGATPSSAVGKPPDKFPRSMSTPAATSPTSSQPPHPHGAPPSRHYANIPGRGEPHPGSALADVIQLSEGLKTIIMRF